MSQKETPRKIPNRRAPNGGMLLTGNPGNKGGGRTRDEFKAKMRELAGSDEAVHGLQSILRDPTHPQYLKALEFAAERGYGKEAQTVEGDMRLTVVLRDE
jgi:ABC-type phosphate transport system auxiliary subunit